MMQSIEDAVGGGGGGDARMKRDEEVKEARWGRVCEGEERYGG